MKPFMLTGFTLIVFMILGPTGAMPMDLSRFQWKDRLLLLFAPDDGHPDLTEMQRQLAVRRAGVADRDLRVFEIVDRGTSRLDGAPLERELIDSMPMRQNEMRRKNRQP